MSIPRLKTVCSSEYDVTLAPKEAHRALASAKKGWVHVASIHARRTEKEKSHFNTYTRPKKKRRIQWLKILCVKWEWQNSIICLCFVIFSSALFLHWFIEVSQSKQVYWPIFHFPVFLVHTQSIQIYMCTTCNLLKSLVEHPKRMVACLCHSVISFFRLFAWRYGAAPRRNNAKWKDEITKKRHAK